MSDNVVKALILIVVHFCEVIVEIITVGSVPVPLIIERRLLIILSFARPRKFIVIRRFWAYFFE